MNLLKTTEATFLLMYIAILFFSLLPGRGIGVAFLGPILLAGYVWLKFPGVLLGLIDGVRNRGRRTSVHPSTVEEDLYDSGQVPPSHFGPR